MICPYCKTDNQEGNYCVECGKKIQLDPRQQVCKDGSGTTKNEVITAVVFFSLVCFSVLLGMFISNIRLKKSSYDYSQSVRNEQAVDEKQNHSLDFTKKDDMNDGVTNQGDSDIRENNSTDESNQKSDTDSSYNVQNSDGSFNALVVSGHYGGYHGQSDAEITMSTEFIGNGHAKIYFDSEIEEYGGSSIEGTIIQDEETNVFNLDSALAEIKLVFSYEYETVLCEVWIDGEMIEGYIQLTQYRS